jgi:transposase
LKQKRYNHEFKQTIIELYRSGTAVSQLSSEYGISEVTIYKWIKLHSPIEGKEELTAAEIAAIQKENLRLKQEVEILKKAMTIFAQK